MKPVVSDDIRVQLRQAGQIDLGAWIEAASGQLLWSVQRRIARAISSYRARVAVPSCNASGKTHLAGRLALAFFDSYAPGTPCMQCRGPCGGSKVITTSSKFDHLRDNLWGEIRRSRLGIHELVGLPGQVFEGDNLRIVGGPSWFIVGHNPKAAEGMQGYHAPHKLIIGDEATALGEDMASGITGLLSSGDSRLLLIANPTTADTWFAAESRTPGTELIRIKAWDTPNFTGETHPPGAALITEDFLEYLKAHGSGPGTYEWTTRVEAEFWTIGEDLLINGPWVDAALVPNAGDPGAIRQLGIDLASYGSAENVIAYREGRALVRVDAFPAMRQELFFAGPVAEAVRRFAPHYVCYDADGVGAGVSGEMDRAAKGMAPGGSVIGFRGALKISAAYNNSRSAWWWALRKRFELPGGIVVGVTDHRLREQLTSLRYSITAGGAIKVETKEELRKRGLPSPDRADAVMYAFALSEDLPLPTPAVAAQVSDRYAQDRSEKAMWDSDLRSARAQVCDPVWGTPVGW